MLEAGSGQEVMESENKMQSGDRVITLRVTFYTPTFKFGVTVQW